FVKVGESEFPGKELPEEPAGNEKLPEEPEELPDEKPTVVLPEITPISPAVKQENTLILHIGDQKMYHNGELIELDVAPALIDGFTMLPIRKVTEAIGGQVDWEASERKITVSRDSRSAVMFVEQTAAFVNGRVEILEKPPIIRDDRTLVPLRFAAESIGCNVEWKGENQEIVITY
ncbi:MAG: copper amine oxidase N-terminal domain-containing protein, partial [Clostridia bacterium]|nr:copper amine oxidase N-terminal domain-containing protein [Clostridia bacterium]